QFRHPVRVKRGRNECDRSVSSSADREPGDELFRGGTELRYGVHLYHQPWFRGRTPKAHRRVISNHHCAATHGYAARWRHFVPSDPRWQQYLFCCVHHIWLLERAVAKLSKGDPSRSRRTARRAAGEHWPRTAVKSRASSWPSRT